MSFRTLTKLTAGIIATLAIATGQAAQAWETFRVNGDMALNTNSGFRKIDGQPRMSLWQHNINDPDQQFNRLPGNRGGILLQHRTTGKCLNAYRVWNGAEINVWNCDANDPDQNFNVVDLGGGYNLIKRANTNFCVDSPTRDNLGKIHLWDCNGSNPNQRWLSSGYVAPPPVDPRLTRINQALNELNGLYAIRDPNGNYPGQCVSFVKRFTQKLGIWMNPMGGNGGARYGFINYNVRGLSLTASQADKIVFTGSQQPQVGDIIFFDATTSNPWGHVAVVQSVLGNGIVVIQESNANNRAPNTYVTRGQINLNSNPPKAGYGRVMGWLRLKI